MSRNAKNNAQSNVNTKARTQSRETPTIVLKIIHDAIVRDNPTTTLTTKIMRVKLRATPSMQQIHTRNASWIFTQSQSDDVRAMFDDAFRQRRERAQKRDAKKRVTPTRENDAQTNDDA